MANFKVGQRVRVVGHVLEPGNSDYRGLEGTVTGHEPRDPQGLTVCVLIDGIAASLCFAPSELSPAVDPHAEQFMEWVRALDKAPIRELQPDEMERVRSAG